MKIKKNTTVKVEFELPLDIEETNKLVVMMENELGEGRTIRNIKVLAGERGGMGPDTATITFGESR